MGPKTERWADGQVKHKTYRIRAGRPTRVDRWLRAWLIIADYNQDNNRRTEFSEVNLCRGSKYEVKLIR